MERGAARARRRSTDRDASSSGSRSPTRPTARSSTASRAPRPRPRRSTTRSPAAGSARRPRRSTSRSRATSSSERLSGRWICRADGHVYNLSTRTRRASPGICDIDGSPLVQRADDQPETIRARLAAAAAAACTRSSTTTDAAACCATVDGAAADRRGDRRRSLGGARRTAGAAEMAVPDRGSPSSRRAEIEQMRRAGRLVADVLDARRVGARAGRHHRRARPHRGGAHPRRRRRPVVQGLPGQSARPFPASALHLDRRRDRPRHPRRAAHRATARSCRSTPARSSTAGTATRRGPSSSASRPPAVPRAGRDDPRRR